MKKALVWVAVLGIATMLTACGQEAPVESQAPTQPETVATSAPTEPETEAPTTEETATEDQAYVAEFADLQALLGMADGDTAELLGGGAENWTEDRAFYIGRNYQVQLKDRVCQVHTSCNENQVVNSVSVWLSDGETPVGQEAVDTWVSYLTDYTGTEPTYDGTTSEVGSQNWKWVTDDAILTLHWLDTIFSISMNPKVGELG